MSKNKGPTPMDNETVLVLDKPSGPVIRMPGDLPRRVKPEDCKVKSMKC